MPESRVIGRFAPSPTGPLHLGSLLTALAGFLEARSQQGLWLLRFDDLDTPRNQPGAVDAILTTLDTFGLHWDLNVVYQSQHLPDYHDYLSQLANNEQVYRCRCSRKTLNSAIYPGTCRAQTILASEAHAIRIKTNPQVICFTDALQGVIAHDIRAQHGDFILKRKDNIFAYQFAVVIDDALAGVNQVVRGCDLLLETPKQLYLQQLLGLATPRYMHVPVIVDANGQKLSKQSYAAAVDTHNPAQTLYDLLILLKQQPPKKLSLATVNEILTWAITHWQTTPLSAITQLNALSGRT
ncbi:tRNA glutamyl-Q(34) synthetase GluQRS [Methylocucumis oryzae]|uniref:Glutamyl-Q tRNA(Asp) synthetase n=1 Tax=Methylocucumis oryzae TaxID=1632867 RepID=A0A0F3IIB2_9GAMM|nr:tRNA glutamyl-Q(34) synthetase GluQRS [Methylocucumis oryzae]KJV06407.1 glutamyl-Q tRNA(Asp) synthetase [Methylocucumis oryzae]